MNIYVLVKRLGFRRSLLAFALFLIIFLWFQNCMLSTLSPELNQGQRVLYQMMGQENLEQVGFFDAYPEARPSDFVVFINSEEGQILWPPTRAEFQPRSDDPQGRDPGRILRPSRVHFSAHEPDPARGRQVVYIPRDDLGKIEFHAYESPDDGPVRTSSWNFPSTGEKIRF